MMLPVIPQDLLDKLVCPACKAPVELQGERQGLRCVKCRRLFPIRDGFPIMLLDQAILEEP